MLYSGQFHTRIKRNANCSQYLLLKGFGHSGFDKNGDQDYCYVYYSIVCVLACAAVSVDQFSKLSSKLCVENSDYWLYLPVAGKNF